MGLLDDIFGFLSQSSDLNQYPSQYTPSLKETSKQPLAGFGETPKPDPTRSLPGPGTFGFGGFFSGPREGFADGFYNKNPKNPNYSGLFDAEAGTPSYKDKGSLEKARKLYGSTIDAMTPWNIFNNDPVENALGIPQSGGLAETLSFIPTSLPDAIDKIDNSDFARLLNNAAYYDDIYSRNGGTSVAAGSAPNSQPEVSYEDIYSRNGGTPSKKMSALNGVTQEEADKLTMEMGLPFTPFFGLPSGPGLENENSNSQPSSENNKTETGINEQAQQDSQTYTSKKPTSEMEEFYEILESNPELAEKYSEFMDRDNYGYSRARASRNSDLFADLALADPRIMNRMRASGIDVDDIENLSNNIYDYMWGDNAIDLYDYMTGGKGYLGDSDLSVKDMLGYLGQNYDYGFDPDFFNRYGLDVNDAYVQALIRNAYAGGAREYDLDRITDLMKEAGYLKDDESLTWGDTSSDYWINNSGKRGNLTQYRDLAGTEYLAPDMGRFDADAALSLSDAIAFSESQLRDANGKQPNRRVVVSNGKGKNAKDYANIAALDVAANLGYY